MATKDPEDIPTFDEWKKKMMEVETEKSKIDGVPGLSQSLNQLLVLI